MDRLRGAIVQRIQNILSVYHQSGRGEIDAGLRWYKTAHEEAARLGKLIVPSLPLAGGATAWEGTSRAAGMIAALSPGLRWERNIEAAERVVRGESLDGLGVRWYDGVKKARRILAGEHIGDVLNGNKVNAFFSNILAPSRSEKVCIDGHAYAIWSAERMTLDDIPPISDRCYLRIETDYREAAEVAGVRPCQLQAITWTTWRRLHNVNSAHFLPLFEEAAL